MEVAHNRGQYCTNTIRQQIKSSLPGTGYLFLSYWPVDPIDSQILQAFDNALDYPTDLDSKALLLKISYI